MSNSFKALKEITINNKKYAYYSLNEAQKNGLSNIPQLPFSLKILLENLLRFEDGITVTKESIEAVNGWIKDRTSNNEIAYRPARVLMQDFTGVPAIVDLAAMRDAITAFHAPSRHINPLIPVDLVIDHSIIVEKFGHADAMQQNVAIEYQRNKERYVFLKWGSQVFENFRVVPPGTGICHQVNVEYLSKTIFVKQEKDGLPLLYPDTCIGTDSHTTMANGVSVLSWGVGGIEAEAAMLGQPISMLLPEVIGVHLTGQCSPGVTATDIVLTLTQLLRARGVVGKFVEYYGPGLDHLSAEDRATIANMSPEYGATCGFFPIDAETLRYLKNKGRSLDHIQLIEDYARTQGLFRETGAPDPLFTDILELDLGDIEACISGPKRPQDRIVLTQAAQASRENLKGEKSSQRIALPNKDFDLGHGDVVIAAITSCTNTSNPHVLFGAGLLARAAVKRGLKAKPWVKTSLAPGSQVVTDYLTQAGLMKDLENLGFYLVGYGCTTCIGNSGPLDPEITAGIREHGLNVASVLSGNRNFEGRINPDVRSSYLASPPLVVAYALAGSMNVDLTRDPLGHDASGQPVFLKDIWPKDEEIQELIENLSSTLFQERYSKVFEGDEHWKAISSPQTNLYTWSNTSTYIKKPPYFEYLPDNPQPIKDLESARILGIFGDSVTTDHISPAGNIQPTSPAGLFLSIQGVDVKDFNSYGSRRGNHEVMMRGTFANIRIKNLMLQGKEGGLTLHQPSDREMTIYDAAMMYKEEGVPLVIFAGKEYGTGSSRDWAAKGPALLGIRAIIASSFERIHRSNLIGMGILPLQLPPDQTPTSLKLTGREIVSIHNIKDITPRQTLPITLKDPKTNAEETLEVLCRIDTEQEMAYFKNGGILNYVLRQLARIKT